MSRDRDEVERTLDTLQMLVRMLGLSNRELERRLGVPTSTVTRAFSRQVELRHELLLGIGRAMGLEYAELFEFLYPERPDPETASPAARRLRTMLAGVAPLLKNDSRESMKRTIRELALEVLRELGDEPPATEKPSPAKKGPRSTKTPRSQIS